MTVKRSQEQSKESGTLLLVLGVKQKQQATGPQYEAGSVQNHAASEVATFASVILYRLCLVDYVSKDLIVSLIVRILQ